MIKFNIKRYLFLVVACILGSAHPYHGMIMAAPLAKPETQSPSVSIPNLRDQETTSALLKPSCAVVYLHGMGMHNDEVKYCAETIKKAFGGQVFNILPTCRQRHLSINLSIPKQAKKVLKEIKEKLRNRFPKWTEEDIEKFPVHLIGYSQGGLLSCYIGHMSIMPKIHHYTLNIKSIIPVHAPLSGIPLLDKGFIDTLQFKKRVKPFLKAINYDINSLDYFIMPIKLPLLKAWRRVGVKRGIQDMRIDSKIIAQVLKFIYGGHHQIPINIMAGYVQNVSDHYDLGPHNTDEFNKACSDFITQDKNGKGKHDAMIPIRSQLARKQSSKNINVSLNDFEYPKNVEIHIDNHVHAYGFFLFRLSFKDGSGKIALDCDETIKVLIEFLAGYSQLKRMDSYREGTRS